MDSTKYTQGLKESIDKAEEKFCTSCSTWLIVKEGSVYRTSNKRIRWICTQCVMIIRERKYP